MLTKKLVQAGCEGIGVDSSPQMVKAAKSRGISDSVMEAANLSFKGEFDAVFSHAMLHWTKEPEKAVVPLQEHFVEKFGDKGNVKTIEDALTFGVEHLYPDVRS